MIAERKKFDGEESEVSFEFDPAERPGYGDGDDASTDLAFREEDHPRGEDGKFGSGGGGGNDSEKKHHEGQYPDAASERPEPKRKRSDNIDSHHAGNYPDAAERDFEPDDYEERGEPAGPKDEAPADLPKPETAKPGEVKKAKDGSQWIRAPKGGFTSPVNGKFYKGGHWAPIHGLSEPKEKTEPKFKGSAPIPPDEDSEGKEKSRREPRQPMTTDEISALKEKRENEAKWNTIRSGPLGKLISMGERPHGVKGQRGNNFWKPFAEEIGDAGVQDLIKHLMPVVEKKALAAHEEWMKKSPESRRSISGRTRVDETPESATKSYIDSIKEYAKDNEGYYTKKHVKSHPNSMFGQQLLGDVVAGASIPELHDLNEKLKEIAAKHKKTNA